MRKRIAAAGGLVALAAGAVVATLPATAAPEALVGPLQRDLNLTADQVESLLASEAAARDLVPAVSEAAGTAFGGTWLDGGTLTVGITDAGLADEVAAAGATPKVVTHTLAALDSTKSQLDSLAAEAPDDVTGWRVDVQSNEVVVTVLNGASNAFTDKAKTLGAVRVESTSAKPRLFADVVGGDAYYIDGSGRCSVGFSVGGGFVTAGHCGQPGSTVSGSDQSSMGAFEGSSFPGNDYGWVATNSSWTPSAAVNGYGNGDVTVTGSTEAGVGSSICRSGSTTGWHCGTVQGTGETVNYAEGTVTGLTRTTVCAEPGDSGGSWVSGSQAQGVTSGGSGNCTSGGTTYFQPVNEILSAYGLSLVTG